MATITKKNRSSKEIQKFMENVYKKAEKELENYTKQMNKTDKEIRKLMECANFIYKIDTSSRDFNEAERFIVIAVLNMLSKDDDWIERFIEEYFDGELQLMLEFYGYFLEETERKEIINRTFKGKNYKQRIKDNQKKINENIEKKIKIYIKKRNSMKNLDLWLRLGRKISFDKAKSLLISELNRILNDAFIRCNKNKKFIYNSVLEKNTCADCASMHGTILTAEQAYGLIPQHSNCKCYLEVFE